MCVCECVCDVQVFLCVRGLDRYVHTYASACMHVCACMHVYVCYEKMHAMHIMDKHVLPIQKRPITVVGGLTCNALHTYICTLV